MNYLLQLKTGKVIKNNKKGKKEKKGIPEQIRDISLKTNIGGSPGSPAV